ncbi:cellulase family glycosylhydrolase [Roseiflexus sp.]|uniref:cellulase family glycosylhydrolase n=1 Tax=Roseiflexus sp. TaxID=2562120 RepID=UPI00398B9CA9
MMRHHAHPTRPARRSLFVSGRWLFLLIAAMIASGCGPVNDPQPGALPPVTADGDRLRAGGRAFEVRGVNYIRPTGDDERRCWTLQFGADINCPWRMSAIEADLDALRARGVNTVRIFLNYYVFGGQREADASYQKSEALQHLEEFIAAANQRGLYILPVLLVEYPQDQFGPAYYERALEWHVRPLVRHFAGRPGILAWDLFNEPDIGSPIDVRCWDWDNGDFPLCFQLAEERKQFVRVIHDEVKRLDPERLTTVGMAFAKSYFEPAEAAIRMADVVDFYTFHYYDNEPYDSGRYRQHWYYGDGFPADLQRAIDELHALGLRKPVVVTELGFPTGAGATRTLDDLRRDQRIALQTIRNARGAGVVLWSFQSSPEELLGDLFTR